MSIERDYVSFGLVRELSWLSSTKSLILSYEHCRIALHIYREYYPDEMDYNFNVFDENTYMHSLDGSWGRGMTAAIAKLEKVPIKQN